MLQIEPEQWYDDAYLRVHWGLTTDQLARARNREGLRCRQIGRKRLYKGEWLSAWLERSVTTNAGGSKP